MLRLGVRLCRRLRCTLLRTRIAQLRCVAGNVRCTTVGDCLYQAALYGKAAQAMCDLTRLERQT